MRGVKFSRLDCSAEPRFLCGVSCCCRRASQRLSDALKRNVVLEEQVCTCVVTASLVMHPHARELRCGCVGLQLRVYQDANAKHADDAAKLAGRNAELQAELDALREPARAPRMSRASASPGASARDLSRSPSASRRASSPLSTRQERAVSGLQAAAGRSCRTSASPTSRPGSRMSGLSRSPSRASASMGGTGRGLVLDFGIPMVTPIKPKSRKPRGMKMEYDAMTGRMVAVPTTKKSKSGRVKSSPGLKTNAAGLVDMTKSLGRGYSKLFTVSALRGVPVSHMFDALGLR